MGVMDRYNEKKKQGTTPVSSGGVRERYEMNKKYADVKTDHVNEDFINSFFTEAGNFLGNEKAEENSYTTWQDIRSKASDVMAWAWQNKDRLGDESYKSFEDSLANFDTDYGEYWSQWDTPEAYADWWEDQKAYYDTWGKYADEPDYDEKSKYVSTATGTPKEDAFSAFAGRYDMDAVYKDWTYDYINKNEEVVGMANVNRVNDNTAFLGLDKSFLREMTNDEIGIYNYLYSKNGKDSANEYLKYLSGDLSRRQRAKDEKYWREYANKSPVGSSAFSVLTSPLKGISFVGQVADYAQDGTIDQNAGYNKFSYSSSAIRDEVSKDMSGAGSFFYNTGMSIGDFLVTTAATGGKTGSAIALALMGTGAAADTVIASKDMGLSDDQAMAFGVVAGAAEVVMEKLSIDALFNSAWEKNALTYVIKNALTESFEEGGTDLINIAAKTADFFLMKDKSEWALIYNGYREEGMSKSQAIKKMIADNAANIGLDMLGGGMSGAAMAGSGVGLGTAFHALSEKANKPSAKPPQGTISPTTVNPTTAPDTLEQAAMDVVAQRNAQTTDTGTQRLTTPAEDVRGTDTTPAQENAPVAQRKAWEGLTLVAPPAKRDISPRQKLNNVATLKKETGYGDYGVEVVTDLVNNKGYTLDEATSATKTAYLAGFTGMDKAKASFVTAVQESAFDAGKRDSIMQNTAAKEDAKSATVYGENSGIIQNEYYEQLSPAEQEMFSAFAEDFGESAEIVNEIVVGYIDGKKRRANAKHVDGKVTGTVSKNKPVHQWILHENGHRMEQFATDEWDILSNALYARAERLGIRVESGAHGGTKFDKIKSDHNKAGINMTTRGYVGEVVMRELETIFSSAEEFNAWRAELDADPQVKSAWAKFMDWLTEILEQIKWTIANRKLSPEARARAKAEIAEIEHIKELYADAYKATRSAVAERTAAMQSTQTAQTEAAYTQTEAQAQTEAKAAPDTLEQAAKDVVDQRNAKEEANTAPTTSENAKIEQTPAPKKTTPKMAAKAKNEGAKAKPIVTDNTDTTIQTLKHSKSVYPLFKGEPIVVAGEDLILSGNVAIPLTDEALAEVKKVVDERNIEMGSSTSFAKIGIKDNDIVISGDPKVAETVVRGKRKNVYVFKVGDEYRICEQKYLDAFNNGENTIVANKDMRKPWAVYDKGGNIVGSFIPVQNVKLTDAEYDSFKSVNDVLDANKAKKAADKNAPFNATETRLFTSRPKLMTFGMNGNSFITDGCLIIKADNAAIEHIKGEYKAKSNGEVVSIDDRAEYIASLAKNEALGEVSKTVTDNITEKDKNGKERVKMHRTACIVGDMAFLFDTRYVDMLSKRSDTLKVLSGGSLASTVLAGYDADGNLVGFIMPIRPADNSYIEVDGKRIPYTVDIKNASTAKTAAKEKAAPKAETPEVPSSRFSLILEEEGNHKGLIEKAYAQVTDENGNILTDKNGDPVVAVDLDTLIKRYDKILDIWKRVSNDLDSAFLNKWNKTVGKDRAFTVFKEQEGYKYSIELSSKCKKGIPLFEAIDTLVKDEAMKELESDKIGLEEKQILYDILKAKGFEIPCAICYVEQARQREGDIINGFLDGNKVQKKNGTYETYKIGWNEALREIESRMKAKGVGYKFPSMSREAATDAYTPTDTTMDRTTQTAFYEALKDITNSEIERYNNTPQRKGKKRIPLIKNATPEGVNASLKGSLPLNLRMFKTMFNEPSSRFTIDNDLLYSSLTTKNLASFHHGLYSIFNSQGGSGGYKTKQGTVVYWADILGKKWKPESVRNAGAIRNQSNSDLMMYTLLDQVQMYIDLTARGYYLHAYTKVLAELKLFGKSDAKINASGIPRVVIYRDANRQIDVAKTQENAGLDKNGNPIYDNIEGINIEEAFMLASDKDYSKSICICCIGYSDKHILKLLDDDRIGMIIGFHDKTDDPDKRYYGARYAHNYNGVNEAAKQKADGTWETKHINFNKFIDQAEKKLGSKDSVEFNGKTYAYDDIPRLAADIYLDYCEKNGLAPAYSRGGYDFSTHPNYYKLLADYGLYDSEGNYAPMKKVNYNMPDSVPYLDKDGNVAYESTEAYITKELESELRVIDGISNALSDKSEGGIIPEFIKRANESYAERKKNKQTEKPATMSYSLEETDEETLEFLENQDHITTYKAMQLIDGKLYPPMAAKVKGEDGKYHWTNASKLGKWQRAVEDPTHITKYKEKNGETVGYYTLNKGNGKSVSDVAYAPYEHSSNLVINDQFEEAYHRDNLVVVECEIPVSEMDGAYKAQYAHNATGVHNWKSGDVGNALAKNGTTRQVYLTRWLKPIRILSDAEVAQKYKETVGDIAIPFNVVSPALKTELEKVGVAIDYDGSKAYKKQHGNYQYSLEDDGDYEAYSARTNKFLDAIDDLRNGKKNAADKLSKYVGSDLMSTEEYSRLLKRYGAIDEGENPSREIKVPKKTADGRKVSQTVRTILEAGSTPDAAIPTIEKMVEDGVFSYDAYSDEKAIKKAEDLIEKDGWDDRLRIWLDNVNKGKVSKDITAMGWALYNNAANTAATATSETEKKVAVRTSIEVLNAMVQHQRSAAQALQATRILKKLNPETQLYGVQKSVSSLQKQLEAKYGKKAPDLKINEELAEQFLTAKTEYERDEAMKKLYEDIGRQMPSNWLDKWNAWRYLAMLSSPRTHLKNISGNALFAPVVLAKDLTATAIEAIVHRVSNGKTVRGKALITGNKADRALLKEAWDDYGIVADRISGGGKYSDSALPNQSIENGRRIFNLKPLEAARKANTTALEVEDMWFARPHYAYALAQFCKANNITPEQIARGSGIAAAREYAIKEAQKATYRDTNAFSQMVSSLGRSKINKETSSIEKAARMAVEGVLPFRKTPANILVRGVEYSPIGLLKSLTYDLYAATKGIEKKVDGKEVTEKMSSTELIDHISAGLTGTGLMALGAFLASQMLVRGHGKGDKDEREFKEMMGHQAYSLELPNGQSVTLDWLAPEALPFFIGVNLWEATRGSDEEITFSSILDAIANVSDPMLEMSFLQGLNDVIENVGYASSDGVSGLMSVLSSAATSYLTQGFPTILGQAERASEEYRMTTYTDKNSFLTSDMQYLLGKVSQKIPGWDYHQIPYIDAWGRKEASGKALERGYNNFLNPAYTSTIEESDMEKELLRLYESTGESSVFPNRAAKYFTVDKKRKDLTADEYVKYATLKGQKSYEAITKLVQSDGYKNLDDAEKVKAIEEAYTYADQKAKAAISSYKADKWVNAAETLGSNVEDYFSFRANVSGTTAENGGKISKAEVTDIIVGMDVDNDDAWTLYLSKYESADAEKAMQNGIDAKTYMIASVGIDEIYADYRYRGSIVDGKLLTKEQREEAKIVQGSRVKKISNYLNTVCHSARDYYFLLGTVSKDVRDSRKYKEYFGE